jgi:hypothetical protein
MRIQKGLRASKKLGTLARHQESRILRHYHETLDAYSGRLTNKRAGYRAFGLSVQLSAGDVRQINLQARPIY